MIRPFPPSRARFERLDDNGFEALALMADRLQGGRRAAPEIIFPPTSLSFVATSLSTAFTLASADSVSLACRSDAQTAAEIRTPGTITAIQVATLTSQ
jgi:hypothetical protein